MKRRIATLLAALILFGGALAEDMLPEDAAAQLHGRWLLFTGGGLLNMAVEFDEDGTLQRYRYSDGDWEREMEDWTLVLCGDPMRYEVCAAPEGKYVDGVPYELRVTGKDGAVSCYGLALLPVEQFGCETFSVVQGEAGGGYCRDGQTPVIDYGGWG